LSYTRNGRILTRKPPESMRVVAAKRCEHGSVTQADPTRSPKSSARRAVGNTLWLLIGDGVAKLAGFAFIVIVARGLGTIEYGYFNLAISVVPLFLVIGVWGLNDALFNELSRDRERLSELFSSGVLLRVALGVVTLIAAVLTAPLLLEDRDGIFAFALVAAALLFDELATFVGIVFKAFEQTRYRALTILVNRMLTTGLAIVALLAGAGIVGVAATYLLGSLGGLIFAGAAMRRRFPPIAWPHRSGETMRWLLARGTPLAIAGILNMAVFRIDTVMLQVMKGPVAVAMYGIAYRFLDSFLFVAWALGSVALPRMARAGRGPQTRETLQMAVALVLVFYLPLAVGALFASDWAVATLFGDRYGPAAAAVFWLMAAAVAYAVTYLARMASLALGERRAIAWIAGLALVFNLSLNAIAIPRWGFQGAAVVTFATGTLEALLLVGLVLRSSDPGRPRRMLWVPVGAAGVMAATLGSTGLRDGAAILAGGVIYAAALPLIARLFAADETRQALGLLRPRSDPGAAES